MHIEHCISMAWLPQSSQYAIWRMLTAWLLRANLSANIRRLDLLSDPRIPASHAALFSSTYVLHPHIQGYHATNYVFFTGVSFCFPILLVPVLIRKFVYILWFTDATLSSLVALQIARATSDDNVGMMTTLCHQCIHRRTFFWWYQFTCPWVLY